MKVMKTHTHTKEGAEEKSSSLVSRAEFKEGDGGVSASISPLLF